MRRAGHAALCLAALSCLLAGCNQPATVVTSDRVVMKLQEPIYIRIDDIPLYAKATSVRPVASWSDLPPLRVRQLRYDP